MINMSANWDKGSSLSLDFQWNLNYLLKAKLGVESRNKSRSRNVGSYKNLRHFQSIFRVFPDTASPKTEANQNKYIEILQNIWSHWKSNGCISVKSQGQRLLGSLFLNNGNTTIISFEKKCWSFWHPRTSET